jgi:competence protein ComEC
MVISIAMGIAAGTWWPGQFGLALGSALMAAVLLYFQIARHRRAAVVPLALCAWAGYLSIQPWLAPRLPDHHVIHHVDKGYWQVYGVVADSPRMTQGRWKFVLSARRLVNERHCYDVSGRVLVTGRGHWPGAEMGDGVVFRGRLRSIRNFANPGGFDYKRLMMLKGIHARIYASARSLKIETAAPPGSVLRHVNAVQQALSSHLDAVLKDFGAQPRILLKALVLGDRSAISKALRDDFNRSGVGHVLAISGLHVGMVAAVAFALAWWMLTWVPYFSKMAWVRKGAALVSMGPVLGYGIVAGLSPSTQRAILMVSVLLLGIWVGRRHDWLNTLALAALLVLMIYPPALLSISFQLSFAAVLAIIAGSAYFSGKSRKADNTLWKNIRQRLLALLWVSAVAVIGTLPIVLHHFNQVSLIGPVVNLVVVPLVGFWVVPAGLLAALGSLVVPVLGEPCWYLAAWGAQLILWVVQLVAAWPWAAVRTVTPNGLEIVLYYLLMIAPMGWKKRPYGLIAAVAIVTLCAADAGYWIYQRYFFGQMRLTAIDVGQATANLIELPGGGTVLVDGGGYSDNAVFDVGAAIVAPLLWRKKIKTVDLMVLSHANSDHLNGLLYVLENFNVKEVWWNQEPAHTQGCRQWMRLLDIYQVPNGKFDQLPRAVMRGEVRLEILAPPADFLQHKAAAPWRDLNNNSLVLRVCYGDVSVLFTGDIMHAAEADLLARTGGRGLQSTVLLVPHHGSRSSSSLEFLKAVRPAEAVISAGWQNRYKFPHPSVLQRLQHVGSRIWCVADQGAVEITTSGNGYTIRTCRPGGS